MHKLTCTIQSQHQVLKESLCQKKTLSWNKYFDDKSCIFFISGVLIFIATMMQIVLVGRNVMQESAKENFSKSLEENKSVVKNNHFLMKFIK